MMRRELQDVPGVRLVPDRATGVGALVLAGSSGRVDEERAALLARHGALAESVQWFGGPGQHDGPWEIALELFLGRVDDLAEDCDRVVVLGTSFGAEAALLTGVHSDRVSAVVAFAPSDVVWTGVTGDGRATSHWTLGNEALACVPFVDDWEPAGDPPAYVDFYRACRARFPEKAAEAAIPVERIPEVVTVAGGDDQVWPAVEHAESIAVRRRRHGLATIVVTDPEAGHRTVLPGEPVVAAGARMARGGTEEADRRLGRAAWGHIQALL
ncbi:acetyl esterase/lipase [Nocardioides thalensis]|uniref:Acetyl esterase/lipase n=1 Tax=Nocardioides thalensis TaxID=1914755 RepID=A0A853C6I6_9ACTN|nr:acyl-CoA thioester hydrolase/BAAT C-terminal domain-containing protein [Nocardioides thalensis]NYJ02292.1 acetyl esterase/lipase [Nocardioides thalensis]